MRNEGVWMMENKQEQIDQAAYIAAKTFNDMPKILLSIFLWIVAVAFWLSVAAAFPKTVSVITVLGMIGYVSEKRKKTETVKWGRVIVFSGLSILFFAASFYQ